MLHYIYVYCYCSNVKCMTKLLVALALKNLRVILYPARKLVSILYSIQYLEMVVFLNVLTNLPEKQGFNR